MHSVIYVSYTLRYKIPETIVIFLGSTLGLILLEFELVQMCDIIFDQFGQFFVE